MLAFCVESSKRTNRDSCASNGIVFIILVDFFFFLLFFSSASSRKHRAISARACFVFSRASIAVSRHAKSGLFAIKDEGKERRRLVSFFEFVFSPASLTSEEEDGEDMRVCVDDARSSQSVVVVVLGVTDASPRAATLFCFLRGRARARVFESLFFVKSSKLLFSLFKFLSL